jgi:hypothetical protein
LGWFSVNGFDLCLGSLKALIIQNKARLPVVNSPTLPAEFGLDAIFLQLNINVPKWFRNKILHFQVLIYNEP